MLRVSSGSTHHTAKGSSIFIAVQISITTPAEMQTAQSDSGAALQTPGVGRSLALMALPCLTFADNPPHEGSMSRAN